MSPRAGSGSTAPLAPLAVLAVAIMAPVTLPVPILRELVHDRFNVSELLTSLFMSINMVGALVAAPLVGALADRIGRRRALLAGALCLDALCFFALTADVPFGLFLGVRFVEGCAHIAALSMLLAAASSALAPERRGRAMGLVGGSMMLGVAIGAPLGGLLGGSGALLPLAVGGSVLLAAALFAALALRDPGAGEARPGFAEIRAALRAHPAILVPLAFSFADRFTVGFFTTTFSLYVRRIHDLPPARIGLAIAIFMLPFALLSYPVGRLAERGHVVALLCGGSLLYAAATASVGWVGPPELYGLMFGIGVTAAVMFVPSLLLTTQLAPDSIRATALGAFNAAGSLGFVLGPLAGGLISQEVAARAGWEAGYRAAFAAAGASVALCVAATFPVLWRLGSLRRGVRAGSVGAGLALSAALALGAEAAGAGPRELVFTGMCDASAGVPLGERLFAVADDEDNLLRVYDADRGGAPLRAVDLSPSLFPPKEKKKKQEKKNAKAKPAKQAKRAKPPAEPGGGPEADLEAATRLGDLAFWMTSHARNRAGQRKDARLRFFATTAAGEQDPLQLVGRAYEGLLDDLIADPRYAAFDLAAAAERAPTEPDGLNLEGLGERAEGGVWIGFRNPTPGGRALLAPLLNPERLGAGERAKLGDPVLLDLGGLGVRSLSRWRGFTLISAGPPGGGPASRLYTWDGRGAPAPVPGLDLDGFNPEGFFSPEERDAILLLSDDGTVPIDGEECKRLEDPERKRFRGRWITLPALSLER